MFDKLLKAFIIIVSLWWFGEKGILLNTQKVFMVGVAVLLFTAFNKPPRRYIKLTYPALFFAYCAANFIYWKLNHIFFPAFISICWGSILFYLVCTYVEDLSGIIKALKLVILLNVILIVLQAFNLDPIFDRAMSHSLLHGFCERTSSMSALLLMGVPFFPPLLILLYFLPNFSGAVFGTIIGSILFSRTKFKFFVIPLLIIMLSLMLWNGRSALMQKYNSRKEMLFKASQMTLVKTPAFGWGLGSFQQSNLAEKYNWDTEMKCEPIEWLFWAGILGWIFAGLWIKDIFIRFWYRRKDHHVFRLSLAILGMGLMSLTQGVFQNPKLMVMFISILALFYIKTETKEVA